MVEGKLARFCLDLLHFEPPLPLRVSGYAQLRSGSLLDCDRLLGSELDVAAPPGQGALGYGNEIHDLAVAETEPSQIVAQLGSFPLAQPVKARSAPC